MALQRVGRSGEEQRRILMEAQAGEQKKSCKGAIGSDAGAAKANVLSATKTYLYGILQRHKRNEIFSGHNLKALREAIKRAFLFGTRMFLTSCRGCLGPEDNAAHRKKPAETKGDAKIGSPNREAARRKA
ncbi:hypothetical protein L596_024285 [Steinernema carpocapsae]|uniref:Uncharacterized protein n=1 Tax=Steinernema carpocapsae TaxID=34508 RepID=A0A4U5MGC0_STECR|nr:hypothetical protein L596_024285 [Steinernema carpocapsae]